jgi:uncharacterized protein YndB with AHSA1/START domain
MSLKTFALHEYNGPMSIITCSTDVVAAAAERIWELLVDASSVARWTGTQLLEGPKRPLETGDHLVHRAGPGLRAIFDVLEVVPRQTLRVDVAMPFGIVNHEVIELRARLKGRRGVGADGKHAGGELGVAVADR